LNSWDISSILGGTVLKNYKNVGKNLFRWQNKPKKSPLAQFFKIYYNFSMALTPAAKKPESSLQPGMEFTVGKLQGKGAAFARSRLTAHGSRLTAHGSHYTLRPGRRVKHLIA
jgi:hypothetical protein